MRRRRRGEAEGEALMYEMEERTKAKDNEADSPSSEDDESIRKPNTREVGSAISAPIEAADASKARRRNLIHFLLVPVLLVGLFALFMFGSYKMSEGRRPAKASRQTRSNGTHTFGPTTIMVSLDGFRADFLDRGLTPTLKSFVAGGVSPKYMLPSFPSVTFPNHWTLVTGLYPESHGVVGNSFWDPDLEEEFYYTDPKRSMQAKWWNSTGAEALWSTCEHADIRTAVHMWPGSEAGVEPEPSTVDKFNGDEALAKKVGRVLGFLDRPSTQDKPGLVPGDARPEFIAFYVPNVDADGHKFGPNSTEIRHTIRAVDEMLDSLLSGLKARNLTDVVNVVVVSDHGMATTSTSRLIQLDNLLDPKIIEHTDGWPLYGLRPHENATLTDLYSRLLAQSQKPNSHFNVYERSNMPERYHFQRNDRIAPLWVIPDAGWAVVPKDEFDVEAAKKSGDVYHPRGLHGYDHEHPLMRAIFVARGPAFPHAPNSRLDNFQNIDVYNIVCDSLGIEPKPNNGTLRLPLKPVGLHGDSGGTKKVDDVADPSEKPSDEPPEDTEADKGETEDDEEDDDDDGRSKVKKIWDFIADKYDDAKEWIKGIFNGGSRDDR